MLSSFARDSKDYWTPNARTLQGQNEVSSLGSRTVPERRMDEKNCGKMERAKGFEPSAQKSQTSQPQCVPNVTKEDHTQIRAQISEPLRPELARVVGGWSKLSAP